MKLIIVEGGDQLGKSTLIKGLCEYFNYDNLIIRHFGKPPIGLTPKDTLDFQLNCFINESNFVKTSIKNIPYYPINIIWNRSHIGEYVYGQMFRGSSKDNILNLLNMFESMHLIKNDIDIYLITLTADTEFFHKNEDGKSYSQTIEEKQTELKLFKEIHELSLIPNKLLIKVDNNGKFKDKADILNQALDFIK